MKINTLLFLLFLLVFASCKKDSPKQDKAPLAPSKDLVDLETALGVAKAFKVPPSIAGVPPITGKNGIQKYQGHQANNSLNGTRMTNAMDFSAKTISGHFTVNDSDGDPAIYVINYAGGGFIILSASKKEHPVLAYSDNYNFPETTTKTRHPVNLWLGSASEKIQKLKSNRVKNADSLMIRSEWKKYAPQSSLQTAGVLIPHVPQCPDGGHWDFGLKQCVSCPEGYTWDGSVCQPPPPCQVAYTVGPLLSTSWHQGCGFNDYAPTDNDQANCNHMPAGCVAVAIGQIFKFWHTGTVFLPPPGPKGVNGTNGGQTYNYSDLAMPLSYGSSETARLLRDIGTEVDMDYSPSGSGANPNHLGIFRNAGYTSPITTNDYAANDILGEISYGRPCILTGSTYGFFPWDGEGHEWVCDGLHAIPNTCYPSYWSGYSVTVHLNWGWGGYCDGWYAPGFWVPSYNGVEEGHHFLWDLKEVTNIWIGNGYPTGND